jgi:hypothetical protein
VVFDVLKMKFDPTYICVTIYGSIVPGNLVSSPFPLKIHRGTYTPKN